MDIPGHTPTGGIVIDGAPDDYRLHYGDAAVFVSYRGADIISIWLPWPDEGRETMPWVEIPHSDHWDERSETTHGPETVWACGAEISLSQHVIGIDRAWAWTEAHRLGKAAWKHAVAENETDEGYDEWLTMTADRLYAARETLQGVTV